MNRLQLPVAAILLAATACAAAQPPTVNAPSAPAPDASPVGTNLLHASLTRRYPLQISLRKLGVQAGR